MKKIFRFFLKSFLFIVIILGIVAAFNHNFDGHCKEEGRILSEEELLTRGAGKIYEENPYCCEIYNSYRWVYTLSAAEINYDINNFFNKLLGYYNYGMNIYYSGHPVDENGNQSDYRVKWFGITSCGKAFGGMGDSITAEEYDKVTQKIKKNRQLKKEQNNDAQN